MTAVFKLVLMGIFFCAAAVVSYKLYLFFNKKIMESNTWLGLAVWSLTLFAALAALLYVSLYLLIVVYTYLAAAQ